MGWLLMGRLLLVFKTKIGIVREGKTVAQSCPVVGYPLDANIVDISCRHHAHMEYLMTLELFREIKFSDKQ